MARPELRHSWVHQRLTVAVETLTTGQGRLQERLVHAGMTLIALRPEDFHDVQQRKRFEAVVDALTNEGTIAATTAILSDEHASEIASDIFALATWAQHEFIGKQAIRDATDKQLVDEAMRRAGLS